MHPNLEHCLRLLINKRGASKSVCPSEVARAIDPVDWRDHMDDIRQLAAEMSVAGELVVTQRGQVVDPLSAKGPIRLRLPSE
ncbi:DUF3253 domain-containing protein [Aeoliella mucimassa]|uniref:S-adenosylmethionine tRNA ribosyltransferase n=1 Tax=Aeoliella mucimassa TaxID=2527972 RepID=A0A518AJ51_9BACT|nr:DUF3253 domain-containing protein [Aeoliella mucimassa]QDU54755.1 hypothetical protein Pan181_09380 [Aeoliella mucimassa]